MISENLLLDEDLNLLFDQPWIIRRSLNKTMDRISTRYQTSAESVFCEYYKQKTGDNSELLLAAERGNEHSQIIPETSVTYPVFRSITKDTPDALRNKSEKSLNVPAVEMRRFLCRPLIGLDHSVPIVYDGMNSGIATTVCSPCYPILNIHGGFHTLSKNQIELGDVYFINDHFGSNNFAHWLLDWVPRLKFLVESKDFCNHTLVFGMPLNKAQKAVLGALKIDSTRVVAVRKNTLTSSISFAPKSVVATNLTGPDLRRPSHHCSPWAIEFIRSVLLSGTAPSQFRKILIDRKTTRQIQISRRIRNTLLESGFETIFLEDKTLLDQARIFNEAQIIIAAHGAGLANLVFCQSNTKVLEIFPENYSTANFFSISSMLYLDYFCAVGKSQPSRFGNHLRDYNIEVSDKIIMKFLSS